MKRAATYNVHASASLVAQPGVRRYFTKINAHLSTDDNHSFSNLALNPQCRSRCFLVPLQALPVN